MPNLIKQRSMNPWVLHLQKLSLELKCPLCLNFFKRPFLLPCDHIICNSCLPQTTPFPSECPICKDQYVAGDLRALHFIDNMVTIYRGLDAAFGANAQSSCSDMITTSERADCNDKLCKESVKVGQGDNSSSGPQNIDMTNKCNVKRELEEYKMIGGDSAQNVNSTPENSQVRAGRRQECGMLPINTNQADQLSAGSPPSFGNVKSPDNDSCNQGEESPTNSQAAQSGKRNPDERARNDGSSGTEGGNLREPKRHKKLDYESLTPCTSVTDIVRSQSAKSGHIDEEFPVLLAESSKANTSCGFCQSNKISEATGPMLHYVNEKPVQGDGAYVSDALHVHRMCIEWAPQVYFVDETVKNLKEELARSSKLKCSKCGLKGAALGCFLQSCRRSYHVTCAIEVSGCRWDNDNFLLLCPYHTSVRFPNEKKSKSKKKKHGVEHQDLPAQVAPQHPNFWALSLNGAKEWVFCGSALSSEEKCLLVKFGSMIHVPVTKFWQPNVTHVIAATDPNGACTRTLKVLMAILNGKWVLTIDWVKACMKSLCPVDEEPYEVSLDNHGCQNGPRMGRLSVSNNAPKLFTGMSFHFVGDFVSGYKEDLQNLVIAAGGAILESEEKVAEESQEQATLLRTLVVYNVDPPPGCKLGEVTIMWQRLREAEDVAAKTGSQVIGHTWLLESIASYKLQPFASLQGGHDDKNLLV